MAPLLYARKPEFTRHQVLTGRSCSEFQEQSCQTSFSGFGASALCIEELRIRVPCASLYIWSFPQYRPQYTIVHTIGNPKKVPLILGNPYILVSDGVATIPRTPWVFEQQIPKKTSHNPAVHNPYKDSNIILGVHD